MANQVFDYILYLQSSAEVFDTFFGPISHRVLSLSGEKIKNIEGVDIEFYFTFLGKLINESIIKSHRGGGRGPI